MKSVIIGDIHDRIVIADKIIQTEIDADEFVFVGDYFDSFGQEGQVKRATATAIWLKDKLNNSKFKMCWGNHDFYYRCYKNPNVSCSGYTKSKKDAIWDVLELDDWDKLLFFYQTQGYLISHAGFNNRFLHPYNGFDADYFNTNLKNYYKAYKIHPMYDVDILGAGESRGGRWPFGGILWQDWFVDYVPIEGLKQIVGHTKFERILQHGDDYNIDALPEYMVIENGIVYINNV